MFLAVVTLANADKLQSFAYCVELAEQDPHRQANYIS